MITIEDLNKLEIRIGTITACEKIEGADKLLKLTVDFGDKDEKTNLPACRQIVSGISQWYTPDDLVGKQCPFLVNLEPRTFRSIESQGMILAADVENSAVLLHPDKEVPRGSHIK